MIQIAANSDNRIIIRCDDCGEIIKQRGYMCDDENGDHMLHFCPDCNYGSGCGEFRVCDACGLPMVEGMSNDATFNAHFGHCFEVEMNRRFDEWAKIDEDAFGGWYIYKMDNDDTWHSTGIKEMQWY